MAPQPSEPPPSPRPGIRDLHRVVGESLTVRQIAVPLESCNATEDAGAVRVRMEGKHFDVAGLRENGAVTGYIRREGLGKGPCRAFRRTFGPAEVVASTTPLLKCLPLLAVRPWVFVLEHTEINGLATRSDLQKPPVRMLLFGLVSLLEVHLLEMVRACYRPGELEGMPGLDEARRLWNARVRRNEDIDLADCLSLTDKHELLLRVPGLADHFRLGAAREAGRYFRSVEDLRNRLAHAQDLVKGSTWERVITTVMGVEGFLMRCEEGDGEFRKRFGSPPGSSKGSP
jgi:hypothetical protein